MNTVYLNLGEKGFYKIFCYRMPLDLLNKEVNSTILVEIHDTDNSCYRIPLFLEDSKNNIFYLGIEIAELFIPIHFGKYNEFVDTRYKIFDSIDKCKEYICSELKSGTKLFKTMKFAYTNWKGEFGEREIDTSTILFYYGKTEWHPEKQWLMEALDINKNETRTFALKDIKELIF